MRTTVGITRMPLMTFKRAVLIPYPRIGHKKKKSQIARLWKPEQIVHFQPKTMGE